MDCAERGVFGMHISLWRQLRVIRIQRKTIGLCVRNQCMERCYCRSWHFLVSNEEYEWFQVVFVGVVVQLIVMVCN